ncbi:hypothetical protein VTK56DRAFT_7755 [Thermocarpiscus australiensis]
MIKHVGISLISSSKGMRTRFGDLVTSDGHLYHCTLPSKPYYCEVKTVNSLDSNTYIRLLPRLSIVFFPDHRSPHDLRNPVPNNGSTPHSKHHSLHPTQQTDEISQTRTSTTMGAVVSCLEATLRTIGRTIMAVINGIGSIIMAVVNGIISFLDLVVGCLTCNYCGGRRHRTGATTTTTGRRGFGRRRHVGTTSTI